MRLSRRLLKRRLLLLLLLLCVLLALAPLVLFLDYDAAVQVDDNRRTTERGERVLVSDVLASRRFIDASPARPFAYYQYNNALSDRIGAFRALPDTRHAACSTRRYRIPALGSRVSVIIAFHNEARSTLLRTLMSLVRHTATRHLHELILVDDCSDDALLLAALQQLNFPPFTHEATTTTATRVRRLRNSQRLGLIESRNRGARLATGDYLLFLDSHCEVNVGWLEPLLERVLTRSGAGAGASAGGDGGRAAIAVSPVLDSIDAATLAYGATSTNLMGGFDWSLHFHWVRRAEGRAPSDAFRSPTFAGGVFLISRNWFFKLNAFNTLLEIWGGEAIEFSIKLWLCGGQIEIVPCSRVGHIFRQHHPFRFARNINDASAPSSQQTVGGIERAQVAGGAADGDDVGHTTYLRNSKVIAESWLDAYKYFFYAARPAAMAVHVNVSHATLDQLKRQLQCRPFTWYLQHVYPQLKLPNDEFIAFGTLSTAEHCLQVTPLSHAHPFGLALGSCYRHDVTHWYLNRSSRRLHTSNGVCLDVGRQAPPTVLVQSCTGIETAGVRWLRRGAQLMHAETHLCLDNPRGDVVAVSQCRALAPSQLFRFSVELQQL